MFSDKVFKPSTFFKVSTLVKRLKVGNGSRIFKAEISPYFRTYWVKSSVSNIWHLLKRTGDNLYFESGRRFHILRGWNALEVTNPAVYYHGTPQYANIHMGKNYKIMRLNSPFGQAYYIKSRTRNTTYYLKTHYNQVYYFNHGRFIHWRVTPKYLQLKYWKYRG